MEMINKKKLIELSQVRRPVCISIFIRTHRAGKETLKGQDALQLKNQLKNIKQKLQKRYKGPSEIEKFVTPVSELINDGEFWRRQSDGLAIFLTDDFFEKYTVPVSFEEFNYVSGEYYLKPLMPLFIGDGMFYLLTLKMDEVKFYEGTRYTITEIVIDDLIPSRLEERVGYDYVQKSLQFRTQHGNSIYHGHGESEASAKDELLRYFRAIDKGLMSLLHDNQKPPLVVACLDYHFPIYHEASKYQNLFPLHISGNPADMDALQLHEKAWEVLQPYFSRNRKEKLEQYSQLQGTGRTSSDMREILPNAFYGKVDTLFLENRTDIFGIYDVDSSETILEDDHSDSNISLTNLVAVKVFEQDGTVYLLEKDDMPHGSSKIGALYRY